MRPNQWFRRVADQLVRALRAGDDPGLPARPGSLLEKRRLPVDPSGRGRLHYAAFYDDVETVAELLASGEAPDQPDKQGFTPLHLAAQQYAVTAAHALLDAGATVDAVNVYGNTPLFVAVFNSEGRGELIHLLRSHGADPHQVNVSGQSPVGLARTIASHDVAQHFQEL